MTATRPNAHGVAVLWQLEVSHYNEKVRWALDYKRVPHVRRSLLPGLHIVKAKRLTGDTLTTPVLILDGRPIGDSTRIIAAIEKRWPQPRLYPEDAVQRRRALELEESFDEQLGPHIRRAVYHELLARPELLVPLFTHGQRLPARVVFRAGVPVLRLGMRRSMKLNPPAACRSRAMTVAAMDRLEREISSSGFLVGDSFTVADQQRRRCFIQLSVLPSSRIRPSWTCLIRRVSFSARSRSDPAASGSRRSTVTTGAARPS